MIGLSGAGDYEVVEWELFLEKGMRYRWVEVDRQEDLHAAHGLLRALR